MRTLERISRTVEAFWEFDLSGRPLYVRVPTAFMRLVAAVLRDLREGQLRLRATSLVYTTLLSLAPLLALSFSVLKGFGVHNQLEPFLLALLDPFGAEAAGIAARIIGFVERINVGVLGVVGFCVLVFSAITLMNAIERALNSIWRVKRDRPFILRVRDYLSILLVGPALMFLSVALTTSARHAAALERWLGADMAGGVARLGGAVFAWLLFAISFTALYMLMPYTRVRFLPAFAAGATTAVLWKALGWLFGFFVAGSARYEAIYSAFAALILFMIWLYIGWLVVLVGASMSYYLQNPSNQSLSRLGRALSLRVREKVALGICAAVAEAFYNGHAPPGAAALARRLTIPVLAVEEVAEDLVAAGVLARTGGQGQPFVPARPFDTTSVSDMLEALRAAEEGRGLAPQHVAAGDVVDKILETHRRALRAALGNTMLKELGTAS